MAELKNLLFELREDVAYITLNRPDAYNAVNGAMARELAEAAHLCADEASLRAVVITGAGRAFCAGGDLKWFAGAGPQIRSAIAEVLDGTHDAVRVFEALNAPVIAAINGLTAGIGLSIASASDYRFATRSAKFTLAYTAVGLSPDGSSTYHLPRLIGESRALELALTNRTLSSDTAEQWGLVNRLADDETFASELTEFVAAVAQGPTGSFGATKHLIRSSWDHTLADQLDREGESISNLAASADGQEGMNAFIEKREPIFLGGTAGLQDVTTSVPA